MSNGDAQKLEKLLDKALKTDWGRKIVGKRLGLEITEHPDLSERPLVAFCMPSYKNPHPQTLTATHRMLAYTKQFADVWQSPVLGSSVVHWARNQLIAEAYKSGVPFTHVFFLDDDIVCQPETLVEMLRHEKDVVAAVCTTRCDPPRRNARVFVEETHSFIQITDMPEGLVEVGGIGTGVMLIARKVLDRVADYWVNCEREEKVYAASAEFLERARSERKNWYEVTKDAFWFQFLEHPHGRGEFGEDTGFCWKAKQCGFQVWADTRLKPLHMGDYGYSVDDADMHRDLLLQQLRTEGKTAVALTIPQKREVTE